ncbi:unnamed protein product (macronuclear) [Paramecium tetraurelia]|uniref:Uncharacterized protein n=1 Tax=Paramecium tetraurelia TaxID=5888 RepID=A0BQH5_PARTE|nr:uncharacterized protein GSPATT00031021001 [Paramecium tetraurelia]CAK60792.1 unnamed protein product [Paramecium tetraurelia]|eukprot:XP_001428190.1 hypothetical protein (macronuclear) [Paramecium tetraurelia strain d4-2]
MDQQTVIITVSSEYNEDIRSIISLYFSEDGSQTVESEERQENQIFDTNIVQFINDEQFEFQFLQVNQSCSNNDVHIKVQEEIKDLQQQQCNQALNDVQEFVRNNCQKAYEMIEYIQKNKNLDKQQEIIMEFYRDIYFVLEMSNSNVLPKGLIDELEKKLHATITFSLFNIE